MARALPKSSVTVKIVVLLALEALLLSGIWWGASQQLNAMNEAVNDIAELKDPSPFRAALMGYLGKIQLGIENYLRRPDPAMADQISASQKDFDASLPQFVKQNPQLFPKAAVEEIRRSFDAFKSSIDHLFKTNVKRVERQRSLENNFARILTLIERNIRPLIRTDQADGDERKESILNVENQARAWQQNLAQAWLQPSHAATELTFENDSRGSTYLDRYARMELRARERTLYKEIRALWQANSDLGRESFAMEKVVTEAKGFMDSQRQLVVQALNQYLPALPPAEFQARKNNLLKAIRVHMILAGLLGCIGLLSLVASVLAAYRWKRGVPLLNYNLPHFPLPGPKKESIDEFREPTLQMDLKGTITQWSLEAEKLYGFTSSEMKGQSIAKLFESESEISRLYKDLLQAPQTIFHTTHKAKGAHIVRVRIEFQPVSDSSGKTVAIGLICTRT